jgi:hypothetical protein
MCTYLVKLVLWVSLLLLFNPYYKWWFPEIGLSPQANYTDRAKAGGRTTLILNVHGVSDVTQNIHIYPHKYNTFFTF